MRLKLAINKELDIMTELGLSAEEWFFIQLLFLYQEGDEDSLLRYFLQAKKDVIPIVILELLQQKNIIHEKYRIPKEGDNFNPGDIYFADSFTKKYLRISGELGLELLQAYPPFIISGTKSFPMKNIAKHFRSLEDFALMYGKAIKFNKKQHDEILEVLEWAKENNAIHFSLPEFVISRKWTDLQKIKNGEIPNYFVPTFDTSELL
jgi:hypothetical protein